MLTTLTPSFSQTFFMKNVLTLHEICSISICIAIQFPKPDQRKRNVAITYFCKPTTEFENIGEERFSNTFFKLFLKKDTNRLTKEKDKKRQLKKRKLNNWIRSFNYRYYII